MKPFVAVALVLGATSSFSCAPAPAERLRQPKPLVRVDEDPPVRTTPVRVRAPVDFSAPEIKVDFTLVDPDPTYEIRWPLGVMDHPDFTPHYDVAKVLAEPGLDWMRLCKLGAHKRTIPKLRDQLVYLRAWCLAGASDYEGAVELLTGLRWTVVPGLASAIRVDLANLLVSHDANSARVLVKKVGLESEMDVLDRLAATYVEVGMLSGAREINELALANDPGKSPAKTCQRLTRRVLLDPDTYRTSMSAFTTKSPVPGFADDPTPHLFGAKLNADPQCKELDAQLSCWMAKGNCAAWYRLRGIADGDAHLLAASSAWPTGKFRADRNAWWNVMVPALAARPKKEAYSYAVLAVEAIFKLTDCDDAYGLSRARNILSELVSDKDAPGDTITRVQWLDENRTKLCFKPD